MPDNGRYRQEPADFLAKIRSLETRLSKLERTPQLSSAGVNSSGISLEGGAIFVRRDSVGEQGLLTVGSENTINGETGMSLSVIRSQTVKGNRTYFGTADTIDGNIALQVSTVDGGTVDPLFCFPTVQVYDKNGDTLIADSLNARQGFSHPYLSTTWYDSALIKSTTVGTFSTLALSNWYMYHPHLRISIFIQNDVGSTSEIIYNENGTTVATITGTSGFFGWMDLIAKRSATTNGLNQNGAVSAFSVQHRRASGAGTVRSMVAEMIGIDLSWFNDY